MTPHETQLLAGLLLDPSKIADVARTVGVEDFSTGHGRAIYAAFVDLADRSFSPADIVEHVRRHAGLPLDLPHVNELMDRAATSVHVIDDARRVREGGLARRRAEKIEELHRRQRRGDDLRPVLRELQALVDPSEDEPEIAPLKAKGPAFPTTALPPVLHDYVIARATELQVPEDMIAMAVLAVLASAAQRRWYAQVRPGWIEPLSIYVVVALGPGERKSSALKSVLRPIRAWEKDMARITDGEIAAASTRRDVLEGQRQAAIRKSNRSEAEALARELAELHVPRTPRIVVQDTTSERLAALLQEHESLGVFSAEAGIFDRMRGRYTRVGTDFEVYLQGHAGDTITVDRQTRETVRVEHPALTLGLLVQPEPLHNLASVPGSAGTGLLARFLYSLPEPRSGFREHDPPPPEAPHSIVTAYEDAVRRLLGDDPDSERQVLAFQPEARQEIQRFAAKIEPRLRPGGDLELHGWGSKLAGATARIAALLHLADVGRPPVELLAVRRAIHIAEYLIDHARIVFRLMGGDPHEALQDPLIAAIDELASENKQDWTSTTILEALKRRGLPDIPSTARGMAAKLELLRPKLDSIGVRVVERRARRKHIFHER